MDGKFQFRDDETGEVDWESVDRHWEELTISECFELHGNPIEEISEVRMTTWAEKLAKSLPTICVQPMLGDWMEIEELTIEELWDAIRCRSDMCGCENRRCVNVMSAVLRACNEVRDARKADKVEKVVKRRRDRDESSDDASDDELENCREMQVAGATRRWKARDIEPGEAMDAD